MARRVPIPELRWSPILNVAFLTIPICAGLLGGWFQLPLLAVSLCIPQAGYLGWFYNRGGTVVVGLLALISWWIPYLWVAERGVPFDTCNAVIGPLVIFIFARLNHQFRTTLQDAHVLADTDALTGLLNRQGFEKRLSAEVNRGVRCRSPLAVVFMDVDDFKKFNDTQGHMHGDELLVSMAKLFQSSIRNYDAAARMGGDEFTLLFPATDLDGTQIILDRIAGQLERLAATKQWAVTWSIGAVVFSNPENPEEMIRAADKLMYEVKHQGKGRVRVREWAPRPPLMPVLPIR